MIPKLQSDKHPLRISSPRDEIIHEAIRQLLKIVFEKLFDKNSHSFRSGKNYHTALNQIRTQMSSTCWFIEGNIFKYYDNIDHNILISKLNKIIKDQPFIDLIYKVLRSRYDRNINNKKRCQKIGLSHKGIMSPILANIYLHEFDRFLSKMIVSFDKENKRKKNFEYTKMNCTSKFDSKNTLSLLGKDKIFKRIRYTRYADNFLIGVIGSKEDCFQIRKDLSELLKAKFKLTLDLDKTKISHASTDGAYFLEHNIYISSVNRQKVIYLQRESPKRLTEPVGRPIINAPIDKIIRRLFLAGYCKKTGNPTRCGKLIHEPLHEIINTYLALQRELFNYYSQASNYNRLVTRIHYVLKYSCALTFASKLGLKTLKKVFKRFGKDLTVFIDGTKNKKIAYPKISYQKTKINSKIIYPLEHTIGKAKFTKRSFF